MHLAATQTTSQSTYIGFRHRITHPMAKSYINLVKRVEPFEHCFIDPGLLGKSLLLLNVSIFDIHEPLVELVTILTIIICFFWLARVSWNTSRLVRHCLKRNKKSGYFSPEFWQSRWRMLYN